MHERIKACLLIKVTLYTFFCKQSIFDPRPENCLNFSKKLPQKNVFKKICLVDGLLTSIVLKLRNTREPFHLKTLIFWVSRPNSAHKVFMSPPFSFTI